MIKTTDKPIDPSFYQRADGFINLANDHLKTINANQVSGAMMFGCSRFNAYLAASKAENKQQLIESKADILQYFLDQYKEMLTANLEEYIDHFEYYIEGKKGN